MFDGPEETLTLTANAQPALMAVSVALVRVLEDRGFDLKTRRPMSPGIRSANIPRWLLPVRSRLPIPPGLLRIRGNAMQKGGSGRARARWRPSSGWSMPM